MYTPLNSIIYSYFGYLKIKNINKLNFNKLEVQKLILIPLDELILLDYKVFFVEQKNELFKQNSNILAFPTKELGSSNIINLGITLLEKFLFIIIKMKLFGELLH